jgi:hypothetical protein
MNMTDQTETAKREFDFEALPVKITYVAKVEHGDWHHFLWNAEIRTKDNVKHVPYKTGLGLVEKRKPGFGGGKGPKKPTAKDIMHSLILDASAIDESFTDWCAELGYSDDSIKAMHIYRECCETGVWLRKAFSRADIEAMREALQDY